MTTMISELKNMNVKPIEILLAEDNPADARLTVEGFKDGIVKHNITVVEDGQKVLDYLSLRKQEPHAVLPNLILLDLNMPKRSGLEVLSEVKSDDGLKMIPVIILTASDAEWDINEAYRLQASAYITKPLDLNEFTKLVESIEEFWFNFVKPPRPYTNGH